MPSEKRDNIQGELKPTMIRRRHRTRTLAYTARMHLSSERSIHAILFDPHDCVSHPSANLLSALKQHYTLPQ